MVPQSTTQYHTVPHSTTVIEGNKGPQPLVLAHLPLLLPHTLPRHRWHHPRFVKIGKDRHRDKYLLTPKYRFSTKVKKDQTTKQMIMKDVLE